MVYSRFYCNGNTAIVIVKPTIAATTVEARETGTTAWTALANNGSNVWSGEFPNGFNGFEHRINGGAVQTVGSIAKLCDAPFVPYSLEVSVLRGCGTNATNIYAQGFNSASNGIVSALDVRIATVPAYAAYAAMNLDTLATFGMQSLTYSFNLTAGSYDVDFRYADGTIRTKQITVGATVACPFVPAVSATANSDTVTGAVIGTAMTFDVSANDTGCSSGATSYVLEGVPIGCSATIAASTGIATIVPTANAFSFQYAIYCEGNKTSSNALVSGSATGTPPPTTTEPVFTTIDACTNTIVLQGQSTLPIGSIIEVFDFTLPTTYTLIDGDVVIDSTGQVTLHPATAIAAGQVLVGRCKRLIGTTGATATYQISPYSLPVAVPVCSPVPTVSQPEIFCPLHKGQKTIFGKVNMPTNTVVHVAGRTETGIVGSNGLYEIGLAQPLELGQQVRVYVQAAGSTDKVYSCYCRAGLNLCVAEMAGCDGAKVYAPSLECFKDFVECLNLEKCLSEDVYASWTKLLQNVFESVNSSIANQ